MTDGNGKTQLVCQTLQFQLPKPMAIPVATPTICGDQKSLSLRIQAAAFRTPPAPDGGNRELSGIMVGTHYDVTTVTRQIVDAVGICSWYIGMREIMTLDPQAFTLCVPFASIILVVSDEFLLFRVHRYHRIARPHLPCHPVVDMLKLRVSVQVLVAFLHLLIALETVVQFVQRGPYPSVAGRVTHVLQSLR